MPDIQQLDLISSTPLSVLLKAGSSAAKFVNQYGLEDLYLVQSAIARDVIPRQRINCILRALPQVISRLIRANSLSNSQSRFYLFTPNGEIEGDSASSKVIKSVVMTLKLGNLSIDLNRIHRTGDLPNLESPELAQLFVHTWQIKNPALRAIKLKLCYKNIYSNERRHRFGLADSPLCVGCTQVESIAHQLVECDNAQRLWVMFRSITGENVQSLKDLILCSSSLENEILKIAIIKSLIQINRNHNVPTRVIALECAYFLRVEAIANSSKERALTLIISKLRDVL